MVNKPISSQVGGKKYTILVRLLGRGNRKSMFYEKTKMCYYNRSILYDIIVFIFFFK